MRSNCMRTSGVQVLILLVVIAVMFAAAGHFIPTNMLILQLALPVGAIVILYCVTTFRKKRPNRTSLTGRFRLRHQKSVVLLASLAVLLLVCAFLWVPLGIRLFDKQSLAGTLAIAAPALGMVFISGYCVLRLLLHVIASWGVDDDC